MGVGREFQQQQRQQQEVKSGHERICLAFVVCLSSRGRMSEVPSKWSDQRVQINLQLEQIAEHESDHLHT